MSKEVKATPAQFEFLDALRRAGVANMLEAALYLAREFGLTIEDAGEILSQWIRNFSEKQEQT